MAEMTRRELLAWAVAGSTSVVAGATWAAHGSPSASTAAGGVGTDSIRPIGSSPDAEPGGRTAASAAETTGAPATRAVITAAPVDDRVLVVVELAGGNDGISTVVPYGLPGYYDARVSTAIDEADVIVIDDEVGFHPALEQVAARGAAVVAGVGTANPDASHFEMMQRWWRGTPERVDHGPGWVGRLVDVIADRDAFAGAVSIGASTHPIVASRSTTTLSLASADAAGYLAGADNDVESAFQRGMRSIGSTSGRSRAHDGFAKMTADTLSVAERLIDVDDDRGVKYPGGDFANSLAFARRLIGVDAGVRVVHVVMNADFDTHEGHGWRHPDLMATFDASVGAFWDDLDSYGFADRVMMMTTSEFGRTLQENAQAGLDHGTASTALMMGPIEHARLGEHPSLTALDDGGDMIATVPFDAYLGAVVERWFEVPAGEVFDRDPDLIDLRLV